MEESNDQVGYDLQARIGFSGDHYHGTLGFAAEKSILEAEYGENN